MSDPAGITQALTTLLSELADGSPAGACYVLNPGDPGLIRSLDRLTAAEVSQAPPGGASIAAHVDHLCYGFELLNRYAAGDEQAFDAADYSKSWERGAVDEAQWQALRARLAERLEQWSSVLPDLDPSVPLHITGGIASIVHLAYHLGAIRQINRSLAGPSATAGQ